MSKKVLITGGIGYIGSHTAVRLIEAGYEIEILDNLANSQPSVLNAIEKITGKRPVFYEVDLLDATRLERIIAKGEYDAVMHFAGLKAVGESVERPLDYYATNVSGAIILLKIMQKYNVNKLVFSSSATVYGTQQSTCYTEEMTTGQNITSPYGQTKYMIEQIIQDLSKAWPNLEASILRYFNPIGAHPSGLLGERPNGKPNNLMPIIMEVAAGKLPELLIYGDDYPTPDGTCIRDYVHVMDVADGHLAALEKIRKGVSVYNLGTGRGTSVLELVKCFEETSGSPLPHIVVGRRTGDLPEFYADSTKADQELDWRAKRSIIEAMRDTLKYLDQQAD